jgi:hypothetical protein
VDYVDPSRLRLPGERRGLTNESRLNIRRALGHKCGVGPCRGWRPATDATAPCLVANASRPESITAPTIGISRARNRPRRANSAPSTCRSPPLRTSRPACTSASRRVVPHPSYSHFAGRRTSSLRVPRVETGRLHPSRLLVRRGLFSTLLPIRDCSLCTSLAAVLAIRLWHARGTPSSAAAPCADGGLRLPHPLRSLRAPASVSSCEQPNEGVPYEKDQTTQQAKT